MQYCHVCVVREREPRTDRPIYVEDKELCSKKRAIFRTFLRKTRNLFEEANGWWVMDGRWVQSRDILVTKTKTSKFR